MGVLQDIQKATSSCWLAVDGDCDEQEAATARAAALKAGPAEIARLEKAGETAMARLLRLELSYLEAAPDPSAKPKAKKKR